jgi:hypothetical protein
MPKDEFDFDDPLALSGVALLTEEDTTHSMAECFIEEFMRLGHGPTQVLALFRNPQYQGPHLAWRRRGEPFVRDLIAEVFTRWGRPVERRAGVPPASTLQPTAEAAASSEALGQRPAGPVAP